MATVCALDVGTSRIKALLLTEQLAPVQPPVIAPSVLSLPAPAVAEVDPEALWGQVLAVLRRVAGAGGRPEALAISNQRATALPTDDSGRPYGPALSWQDTRGSEDLQRWLDRVGRRRFAEITGLAPSTIWSVAKILWWVEQGLPAGARIATLQDWLLRRLGAPGWTLDHANGSLVGLMDIRKLTWDEDLLRAAGLTPGQLPALSPSGVRVGALSSQVAAATGLPAGMPLVLGGGDQQCSALGLGVLQPGTVAVNLGTAGVVGVPTGQPVIDPRGRLVCLAHVVRGRWVLEGLEETYGGAQHWGYDLLGRDPVELAAEAPLGSRGLLFLPYLAGSGAPDYDARAHGVVLGLSLAHTGSDLARALLEGITIELVRILDVARELLGAGRPAPNEATSAASSRRQACEPDSASSKGPRFALVASGGGARRPLLLAMLSGLAGLPVTEAVETESSLVGAGLLAWVGLRRWPAAEQAAAVLPAGGKTIYPNPAEADTYRALYRRYLNALAALRQGGLLALEERGPDG